MPENILKTRLDVLTNAKKLFCQSIVQLFFLNIFEATNHFRFFDLCWYGWQRCQQVWTNMGDVLQGVGKRGAKGPWPIQFSEQWGPLKCAASAQTALQWSETKEGTEENSVSTTRGHWFDLQLKQCFFPFGHQNIWLLATSLMCWAHYWIIGET